jgi:hypothetical protein
MSWLCVCFRILARDTYLLGGDLNSDLFDGLGEFIGLNSAVVVEIEVLEGLLEDSLLGLCALGLFGEFVLEFALEAIWQQTYEITMESLRLTLI